MMTLSSLSAAPSRRFLAIEAILLFIALPTVMYVCAKRWNIHLILWACAGYAFLMLRRQPGYTWRAIWRGDAWPPSGRRMALLRFIAASTLIVIGTSWLMPQQLFAFPLQRPWFWLLVMVLYPLLSVVPQELVFRSFFFSRYANLFPRGWLLPAASAASFGFMHVVLHNWVSPPLCLIAGAILAHSYTQHRSLKWASIEHALYGCMVFTVGIGRYFYFGGVHHG